MKQKWHRITITIKLKIHTKNDCQRDFNDEDIGMTYGEHSTNSIYY